MRRSSKLSRFLEYQELEIKPFGILPPTFPTVFGRRKKMQSNPLFVDEITRRTPEQYDILISEYDDLQSPLAVMLRGAKSISQNKVPSAKLSFDINRQSMTDDDDDECLFQYSVRDVRSDFLYFGAKDSDFDFGISGDDGDLLPLDIWDREYEEDKDASWTVYHLIVKNPELALKIATLHSLINDEPMIYSKDEVCLEGIDRDRMLGVQILLRYKCSDAPSFSRFLSERKCEVPDENEKENTRAVSDCFSTLEILKLRVLFIDFLVEKKLPFPRDKNDHPDLWELYQERIGMIR